MLRSYLRLSLFALGLLLGVQVPGFIDDYAKRVDARRLEAEQALQGFQETARRFFHGDLEALLGHYRASEDPVFQNDAASISRLIERYRLLQREWQAMQGPWYAQAWHLVQGADRSLLRETLDAYRYQVLLAPEAIAWGIVTALLLAWLVESLLLLFAWLLGGLRDRRSLARHRR